MKVWKEFHFDSAHLLPLLPEHHKCRRLHGHTFRVRVEVDGPIGADGLVIDFADIGVVVDPIIEQLDHRYLNDIPGLENPTSEHLALWLAAQIGDRLPVAAIEVSETCHSGARYEPPAVAPLKG
jgi:6-pyruvoyltetrahydropterin/6-carboxytetrahydropterin synthase